MTPPYEEDAARFLAAQPDPFERFIKSLTDPALKDFATKTMELRRELQHHVTAMLLATEPREAIDHAAWVASHAIEVARDWAMLRAEVTRFEMRNPAPIAFQVSR